MVGIVQVKAHPFFKNINWDTLARQKVRANTSSLDHIYLYFQAHISLHNVSLYLSVIFCLMNVLRLFVRTKSLASPFFLLLLTYS
jgi:hypothetical protein